MKAIRKPKKRGFTIVEVMICIAMASVLAGVTLPRLVGQRIKAAQAEVVIVLAAMDKLQTNAMNEHGRALRGFELLSFGGLDPKILTGTKFYEFTFSYVAGSGVVTVVAQDTRQAIYPGWPDVWRYQWQSEPCLGVVGLCGRIGGMSQRMTKPEQLSNAMSAVM
jgi:prepilin-type N-terminal cleavage/methylation domain-containing protein